MSLGRVHRALGWVANLPPASFVVGARGWKVEVRFRLVRAPELRAIAEGARRRVKRRKD